MIRSIHLFKNITNKVLQSSAFHTTMMSNTKIAVVLSGCGVYDGSEIHEASSCLVHLSRAGADVSMFAPDVPQMHVIDHTKGQPNEKDSRNVLQESARIARGKISPLSELQSHQFNGLVFPGGFGAAKNLSTFAVDNVNCKINEDVSRVIKDFHAAKKPIGMCCISPVIAAKLLPGCEVTVGQSTDDGGKWPYAGTAQAINEMGAKHINKNVKDVHIDSTNLLVTTPAFMCETALHEIFDGIGEMITNVMKMAAK